MADTDILNKIDDAGDIFGVFVLLTFFIAEIYIFLQYYTRCKFDKTAVWVLFLQLVAFMGLFCRAFISYNNYHQFDLHAALI